MTSTDGSGLTAFDMPMAALIEAALSAGAAAMAIYARADLGVHIKSDKSPVTAADEAAEAVILAALTRLAPELPVVAEEATAAGKAPKALGDRFALVDPLDGTKEFIARNGEFTVNIGLIEMGRPVAGVVYAPVLRLVWWGVVGAGAFVAEVAEGERVGAVRAIRARAAPPEGYRVMASRSHGCAETEAFLTRFRVSERVTAGSSLKFCRIAEGVCDLYPRHGPTMEWDTAAGDAVLSAAGGAVTDLQGRPLAYGKRGRTGVKDFANPDFVAMGVVDPVQVCRHAAP
jgi:3'(2'),5'-bisphosphate nucleotidase